MTVTPDDDRDGVDRPESDEIHENTRSSAEGVEETPETGDGTGASPGIIGRGEGVDPRYLGQR